MKKIIVPIDFSENSMSALKTGIEIANKLVADVRIVHVMQSGSYASGYDNGTAMDEGKITSMLDKLVLESNRMFHAPKCKIDYKLRNGNIAQELINQAKYDDATIVVMGSHGVSGITESWIGGNAYKMICNAPCPILVIRPDMKYDNKFKRIVIPIEISKSSRYKIPVVAGVAKLFGAKVTLIGVQNSSFKSIFNRINVSVKQTRDYLTERAGVEVDQMSMLTGKDNVGRLLEIISTSNADMVAVDVTNSGTFITDRFRPFLITLVNSSQCPVLAIPIKE